MNQNTPVYLNVAFCLQYGVPIQTVDAFLRLPSPVVSSWCSDANPAGWKMQLNSSLFAVEYSVLT